MKKIFYTFVLISIALAACGPSTRGNTNPNRDRNSNHHGNVHPLPTDTPTSQPTSSYPLEGYGRPIFFGVDPLTGLEVADPALLVAARCLSRYPTFRVTFARSGGFHWPISF